MPECRFPAPWTIEEYRGILVRDANNFAVAYVYFESEPGRRAAAKLMTKEELRKVAVGIAELPELLKVREEKDPGAWLGYAGAVNQRRQGHSGRNFPAEGAGHRIKNPKSGLRFPC